jgi:AraC family transcriptional regulator
MEKAYDLVKALPNMFHDEGDGLPKQLLDLLENAKLQWETDLPSAKALVTQASHLLRTKPVSQQECSNRTRSAGGLAGWQIGRVTEYIELNLANAIPVSTLSDIARLSTTYFARAFRQEFKCSPHQYVINRRIERAKALLSHEDLALCEIALMCGFADQSHLSRTFGRLVGCSPVGWRREKYSRSILYLQDDGP